MIKTYQRVATAKAIQFEDTPECLEAISQLAGADVRVDYSDKDNPVLQFDGSDTTAQVGEMIINEDGDLLILPYADFVRLYKPCDTAAERMVIEIEDLVEKFSKLNHFMKTDKFLALPNEMIGLLQAQYGAMMAYSHVLQLRLSKMPKD